MLIDGDEEALSPACWWGRFAGRVVSHPGATLAFGLVAFGALATAVLGYRLACLGSTPAAPRASDSAARC